MSGLTKEGLIIQRLNDIIVSQREAAINLFREITPVGEDVDTSENTTIGRLISLSSPSQADLWEALEEVYNAFDPDAAEGLALDKLAKLMGLTREPAQKAVCQLLLTGNAGVTVPYASSVRGEGTNVLWNTRADVTFAGKYSGVYINVNHVATGTSYSVTYSTPSGDKVLSFTTGGSATEAGIVDGLITAALTDGHPDYILVSRLPNTQTLWIRKVSLYSTSYFTPSLKLTITQYQKVVSAQADVTGEVVQPVDTVNQIATPVLGWVLATNFTEATGGRLIETDSELRNRMSTSKYDKASNILESLYSALKSVTGVTEVIIYENESNVTDVNGVPAKSFMCVIAGGDDQELVDTIWKNKPLGILSYQSGATFPDDYTFEALDSQGYPHPIGLNRPTPKPIYISIDLETVAGVFPSDGIAQMKSAIVEYFKANFGISDDILYSRVYSPVNSIVGHYVNTLTLGTAPSPTGTSNIPIAFNEIYTLNPDHIIITV